MRVLIAEDDPVSRRILQVVLAKWGYDVAVAHEGAEAWEALQAPTPPPLAILDWMMPNLDGPEICRRVRQQKHKAYLYIILLTTKGQKQDIVEGMEAGADDYLTKPFHAGELKARLRAAERIIYLQAKLIAAREALLEQATHDGLTRLWNRAAIFDVLRRELAKGDREKAPVGVVMADLDHFKQINDAFGHEAGDVVLRGAASRITAVLRPYDAAGRYGGEEFLVILPGCDMASAAGLAERLRACIAASPFEWSNGRSVPLTVSLGATASAAGTAPKCDALISQADAALYRAKEAGRNRVMIHQPDHAGAQAS